MLYDPSSWHKSITRHNYWEWRAYLKLELLRKRQWRSDWSGRYLSTCEMHEGILTRANAPLGLPFFWMIYHEYNCFLLLTEEHHPQPPSRGWCIQKSFERYGEDAVRDWFNSIPFKVRPFLI
jgi:hypothetical protein